MTNATGLFRQTIYYPYYWTLQYVLGSVLNLPVQSPTYEVPNTDPVAYLDVARATHPGNGQTSIFLLSRDFVEGAAGGNRLGRQTPDAGLDLEGIDGK